MEIKLGNMELKKPADADKRISMVLWGPAGTGKTTLAATAPGKKMWILFDPDGDKSLINRDDVYTLDLSGERNSITGRFMDDDPMGIERMLKEHPEIETVVFDSVTSYAVLCTENAVAEVKSATMENPGLKGFGHRNSRVLRAVTSVMRLTKRQNRHFILIGHEDTPEKREDGSIVHITMALGGKMTNQIGLTLSEIWNMTMTDKGERRIAIRPCRMRQPMKSRMFRSDKEPEFVWKFNADTLEGEGIEDWFRRWEASEGKKIDLPK